MHNHDCGFIPNNVWIVEDSEGNWGMCVSVITSGLSDNEELTLQIRYCPYCGVELAST